METQEKQEVKEATCSVCDGYLIDALTGFSHDFYKDVLKCCSCGRLYRLIAGHLVPYTGRGV